MGVPKPKPQYHFNHAIVSETASLILVPVNLIVLPGVSPMLICLAQENLFMHKRGPA